MSQDIIWKIRTPATTQNQKCEQLRMEVGRRVSTDVQKHMLLIGVRLTFTVI